MALQKSKISKSLSPAIQAYALGYAASTVPRLLDTLLIWTRKKSSFNDKVDAILTILKTSTHINRFPTTCGIIVGGATALPQMIASVVSWLLWHFKSPRQISGPLRQRLRLICTFLSAWLAFDLLNRDLGWARKRAQSRARLEQFEWQQDDPNRNSVPDSTSHLRYAGKTIDFTLFAVCRAIDVSVASLWIQTSSQAWHPKHCLPKLAALLPRIVDPVVFSSSAAIVMWSWFYCPERLPKAYNNWISKAADIDSRLIRALRLCRQGEIVYGIDTGYGQLLKGLCEELKLPPLMGDPAVTVPIPCELYHCGLGKSCELHAASRFWRSWMFALRLYLPLQLFSLIRRPSNTDAKRIGILLKSAFRSASFLAAFVSFFYYAVCLARTRLGPKVISRSKVTPQMWDSGLCVLAGCIACGWSILIENPSRRQEIASFVAPRALATILPRVYDKRYQRREQIVFATSVAIVINAVQRRPDHHVRGVFGKLLQYFFNI